MAERMAVLAGAAAFLLLLVEPTRIGVSYVRTFRAVNLALFAALSADVLLRFLRSGDRRRHVRRFWPEWVILLPLVEYMPGVPRSSFFVVCRLAAALVALVPQARGKADLWSLMGLRPAQVLVVSFLAAIGVGSILLMLPASTANGAKTGLVDALFTATSAVCVTGLTVRDTATHFSTFGQIVILLLIQAGGLGIMTFSVWLALLLGRDMDVRGQAALQNMLDHDTLADVRRMIRFIVLMTLVIEVCGAAVLFAAWYGRFGSPFRSAYHALFHAISAFCNAGFSTFRDNLVPFRGHLVTNLTICGLIVAGGLGFTVIRDMARRVARRDGPHHRTFRTQTKVVLTLTAALVAGGALLVYVLERRDALRDMPRDEAWMAALFQSVTARTAGFNTLDVGRLLPATLVVTVVLMFIGASPGSTAGGIKTTTAAVLASAVACDLRQRQRTELCGRTIPEDVVVKALTVCCLSLALICTFTILLLWLDRKPLMDTVFETVSAFGTVGLSTGITPAWSRAGKLVLTALMFIGRLGPLTVAYALGRPRMGPRYTYAEERIMIG
jgi:trk system potassium uptake protein TrkH